jgi:hypothetical protein
MANEQIIDNLPHSPLGVLRQISISRAGIDVFSDGIIQSIKDGEIDPLEVKAICKALELIVDRVNNETRSNQLRAANKYPEEKFTAFGMEFTKATIYTKYDYASCGDLVWDQRKRILEAAEEQLKEREAFLKNVKEPCSELDEGSGEIFKISPPKITRIAGLKISIK